jgi:N-acetyl-anhydromuramyl-L-alanine amidase AmpD
MKLYARGKWFALWQFGTDSDGRVGIEINPNSWKLGVEAYPRAQVTHFNPLATRVMVEVQVGPVIAYVTWK